MPRGPSSLPAHGHEGTYRVVGEAGDGVIVELETGHQFVLRGYAPAELAATRSSSQRPASDAYPAAPSRPVPSPGDPGSGQSGLHGAGRGVERVRAGWVARTLPPSTTGAGHGRAEFSSSSDAPTAGTGPSSEARSDPWMDSAKDPWAVAAGAKKGSGSPQAHSALSTGQGSQPDRASQGAGHAVETQRSDTQITSNQSGSGGPTQQTSNQSSSAEPFAGSASAAVAAAAAPVQEPQPTERHKDINGQCWEAYICPSSNRTWWWNPQTETAVWERPT
eukprot:TRINITY_DN62572_c0_g1_i1.p1 TRINITY_DN62572_c0_g1~~TRINITY_DN62572_c0_g1_i1.p1  ORF type:complete len:277 (+),score=27.85 TRINITY_DN62572_c0_g1_i1:68-898(+)